MTITLKGSARVKIPEERLQEVLSLYVHYHRDGSFIRNYKHSLKDGYTYLPLNPDKLFHVTRLLNETLDDQRSPGESLALPFVQNPTFQFKEHQSAPAAKLLLHCQENNNGVLQASCGCGKTVVMTWVAGKLARKTLILVDMGSLQSQWQEAYGIVWGRDVQIITKDTKEFSDVCVATFQLLHLNPELVLMLRELFGTILLDEFHTTGSDTRSEVLFKMNAMYRIGCTATLMKKGYADDVLTDVVSSVSVVMVDSQALKASVEFHESGQPFYSSDPDDWGKIQSHLGKDDQRNKFIAGLVVKAIRNKRKVLVVGVTVESLKYIDTLLQRYPECRVVVYTGSTSLQQDKKLRTDLAEGIVNVIMTVKKADKGLDLPSLDYLILARPANNEAFIIQIAGRIVRSLPGKPTPIVADIVDKSSLAERFAKNRRKWYKKLGYSIKNDLDSNSFACNY